MSQNKHTPGPWFVDRASPFLVRAHNNIDGRHIAHVGPANYVPRFDVDEPNAWLIAAAPDLLESLVTARDWIEFSSGMCGGGSQILEEIDKAIAKARGEQP